MLIVLNVGKSYLELLEKARTPNYSFGVNFVNKNLNLIRKSLWAIVNNTSGSFILYKGWVIQIGYGEYGD